MSDITILMYHSVSASPDRYSVSPETFRRHMEVLKASYSVVRLSDIRNHFQSAGRKVIVTFDDAFCDFAEHAYPILRHLAIPATMFVPTAHVGSSNRWDATLSDVAQKAIMTEGDLRALSTDGFVEFGSHTADHRSMRGLTTAEMRHQAMESRRYLQALLGQPITMFSYPYGQRCDFSQRSERVIAESGYEVAVTTCWGTKNTATDLLRLRRISLDEQDDAGTVRAKIEGRYDWIGLKEWAAFTVRSALGTIPREPAS